jgi:hypothetical protein
MTHLDKSNDKRNQYTKTYKTLLKERNEDQKRDGAMVRRGDVKVWILSTLACRVHVNPVGTLMGHFLRNCF